MKPINATAKVASAVLFAAAFIAPSVSGFDLIGIDAETGDLFEISTADATPSWLGSTGMPGFGSLELGPDGFLYGFTTGADATLYVIDPVGFGTTEIGPLDVGFVFDGSLVFAPGGTVYGTNHESDMESELFTVDIMTGRATNIGPIGDGNHDINAMVWRDDSMLVGLDRISNALLAIDPADASTTLIAAIDPVVGGVGGMTVADDTAYFTTSGPGGAAPGSNELYTVDLFTGGHALVGTLSPTITGVGISGLAVPEPASLLLMLLGGVVLFRRR